MTTKGTIYFLYKHVLTYNINYTAILSIRAEAHGNDRFGVTRNATGTSGDSLNFELCLRLIGDLEELFCLVMLRLLQCLLERPPHLCLVDVELVGSLFILGYNSTVSYSSVY